jgi:hypothetical protein
MKHIYFIRSYTNYYNCDYYEQKTDIWIFGDIEGYKYLVDNLKNAKGSEKNIRLQELDFRSNTMNVVILKPGYNSIKQPRLKFAERIIFVNNKPEVELIIFGNKNGYDFLINTFNDFINDSRENLEDHLHLDDQDNKEIVKRSISLNIRDALKKWDKKKLKLYRDFIYENKKKYLPYDLNDYKLIEPYTEIDTKDNVYLTLRRK